MIFTVNTILYFFKFLNEDSEFQVEKTYKFNTVIYNCGLPLMGNADGVLIESPSASRYIVPLDYGIKECDVSILLQGICSSVSINGNPLSVPVYGGYTTGSSNSTAARHNEYEVITNSSNQVTYRVTKINQYEILNFKLLSNVVNGKSPNKLFEVDGSGNTISLLTPETPSANDPLFILKLYNIKFGGVPSPDY